MSIELIKDMAEAVKATVRQQERTAAYDTPATVRRIEGGTAWVHIPGGVDETPVRLTIACKPGDTVQVHVGGGSAWLVGNATAPPTDDTRANEIYELLKKTRKGLKEVIKNEVDEMIDNGEVGKGILKVVIEHCLANARSIPIGGTFEDIQFSAWQEVLPVFVTGKYYWARIVTYYADGTVEYGPPYFDMGAQVTAEVNIAVQEAQDTADEAERIAREASQTAGASRKVFNSTPVPPYGVNDLWFDGPHGITYLCSTAKAEGESFAQADWTEYSEDVSSHFWTDASGAHIAENQGDVTTGASQTISSSGTVMMRNGKVISSWTGTSAGNAAINFYDLSSSVARDADLIASYGRAGITHYINNVVCQALTASGLSFFNPDANNHYLEAVFGSAGVNLYALGVLAMALTSGSLKFYDTDGLTELAEFCQTYAQIGRDDGPHTYIGATGMQVYRNGSKELAHIGYGSSYTDSGVSDNPYYTFGSRSSGNIGAYSFSEGQNNVASGYYAHAEGSQNTVSGHYAHVENGGIYSNTAAGYASHVEGSGNTSTVNAHYAHVGGVGNTARYEAQTIIGKYAPSGDSDDLFIVGNGIVSHPSSAMRLKDNGRVEFAGAVGTGLTWKSRTDMCNLVKELKTMTPYNFSATWADTGSQTIYWGETAGAEAANCFGTICRMTTTSWHMFFMCNGNLYKSVFAWDGAGTTTGTFSTTLIG